MSWNSCGQVLRELTPRIEAERKQRKKELWDRDVTAYALRRFNYMQAANVLEIMSAEYLDLPGLVQHLYQKAYHMSNLLNHLYIDKFLQYLF